MHTGGSVHERERERQTDRQTDTETQRETQRQRVYVIYCLCLFTLLVAAIHV